MAPMSALLVATTNAGKIREIRALLAHSPVRLLTLADVPPVEAPEETGVTFAENARLKAQWYAAATGLPTLGEDSGLEVDRLGGRPGVLSARYAGEGSSDAEKFALLYAELSAAGATPDALGCLSAARFVCAVALVEHEAVVFEATGTVEGAIAPAPMGQGGFGYDPVFMYPPFGTTLAAAGERKAEVSHRAAAMRHLRAFLETR